MDVKAFPLWTALITPMNSNNEIDYDDLKNCLLEQEKAYNGVLILGSTGESLNLDIEEKKAVVEFASKLKLKVPLMVGVGGFNLKSQLQWIEYLESKDIHSYLVVTPLYAKPGAKGQAHWYKTLLDKSSKPVMLYNIPGRTGMELLRAALVEVVDHPNLWALKEASGSTDEFEAYVSTMKGKPVYSGDDPMLPQYVKIGAKGLVSVASNVWPAQTHKYVDKALSKALDEKEALLWQKASESLFESSNPIPAKAIMTKLGMIKSPQLRAPLTHTELQDINTQIEYSKEINNWMQNQG